MADETLNVKIKVQADTSAVDKLNGSLSTTAAGSTATAEALTDMSSALKSVRTANLASLGAQLLPVKSICENIKKNFENIRDTSKSLKSNFASIGKELKNVTGSFREFSSSLKEDFGQSLSPLKSLKELANGGVLDDMKSAFSGLKTSLTSIFASVKSIFTSLIKLVGTLIVPITIVAGLITKFAVKVAATGDQIKDEANKVFLSTTAYQEWGYVLEQNGVEMSSLKTGMRTFAKEVASGDAKLKKYGITATNVDDAFEQAVFTIQNMKTETEKVTAATELFGNRATELMSVFNQSAADTKNLMDTYRAIGGTMSNELINASDVLTDSITAMKAAWQGLSNTIASAFMPVITKVVQWLTLAIAYINVFLKVLFGVSETFGGGGEAASGSAEVADNMSAAAGSAKEMKKLLSGFDELNIFSDAGGGGGGGSSVDMSELEGFGDGFQLLDDEQLDKIQKFKETLEKIRPIIVAISTVIATLLTAAIAKAILKTLGLNVGFGKVLGVIGAIAGAILLVKGFIDSIKNGLDFNNLTTMLEGIALMLAGLGLAFGPMAVAIGACVAGVVLLVAGLIDFCKTGELSNAACVAIVTGLLLLGTGISFITGQWVVLLIAAIVAAVIAITKYSDEIKAAIEKCVSWINEKLTAFTDWLKNSWVGKLVYNALGAFIKLFQDSIKAAKDVLQGLVTFISGIFTGDWNKAWEGVKQIFKGVWEAMVTVIKYPINQIIGVVNNLILGITTGLNAVIRGINKISVNIPEWVPYYGGSTFGLNIKEIQNYQIPLLASGGVLTTPTIAMMGEYAGAKNNPEIAAPQNILQEIIAGNNADLISAFAQVGRQIVGAIENQDMEVSIGDDVIARSAQRGNRAYKLSTGKSLF